MAYPKEIMDKAFETLAERRSQARNDYQYRLQGNREKVPAVEELRGEQLAFRQSSPVAAVEKLQPMKLPSMTPAAPKPVPVQKPVTVPEKGRMVHDDWRPPYQTAQPLPIEPEEEEVLH